MYNEKISQNQVKTDSHYTRTHILVHGVEKPWIIDQCMYVCTRNKRVIK